MKYLTDDEDATISFVFPRSIACKENEEKVNSNEQNSDPWVLFSSSVLFLWVFGSCRAHFHMQSGYSKW